MGGGGGGMTDGMAPCGWKGGFEGRFTLGTLILFNFVRRGKSLLLNAMPSK